MSSHHFWRVPRDADGNEIREQDVELPETRRERDQAALEPYTPGSLERAMCDFAAAVAAERRAS